MAQAQATVGKPESPKRGAQIGEIPFRGGALSGRVEPRITMARAASHVLLHLDGDGVAEDRVRKVRKGGGRVLRPASGKHE